jgi:hypothetical protein
MRRARAATSPRCRDSVRTVCLLPYSLCVPLALASPADTHSTSKLVISVSQRFYIAPEYVERDAYRLASAYEQRHHGGAQVHGYYARLRKKVSIICVPFFLFKRGVDGR